MTSSRLMVREGTLRVPCSVRAWPGQNSESHAADEKGAGARVGAVVDAGGVFERIVEHPHERRGDDGEYEATAADDVLARTELAHEQQQDGPDEVELLLDGK